MLQLLWTTRPNDTFKPTPLKPHQPTSFGAERDQDSQCRLLTFHVYCNKSVTVGVPSALQAQRFLIPSSRSLKKESRPGSYAKPSTNWSSGTEVWIYFPRCAQSLSSASLQDRTMFLSKVYRNRVSAFIRKESEYSFPNPLTCLACQYHRHFIFSIRRIQSDFFSEI